MVTQIIKKLFPFKFKRSVKEHLGVPSLHWSLQNLKKKGFNPAVIIDIGAYEGYWTQDVMEVYPDAKILMIEAQESKEQFLKKIKEKHSTVDYSVTLLSSISGGIKTFIEDETASHITDEELAGRSYKRISSQTLDDLLENIQFPLPDLLKLDVQGHEMEVLKGAQKALAHAAVCLLEISFLDLGDNNPLLAEMIMFMDGKGFQAYDISQFIRRPFDKALYQADIFFVKKDSLLIADKTW